MQLRYEMEKNERQNDVLRQKISLQKVTIRNYQVRQWHLYFSIVVLSIFLLFGYYKYFTRSRASRKLHRRIEKALQLYKEKEQVLIHHSALTTLGKIAASIMHDLKQPLQDIRLSAEEIEQELQKTKSREKNIKDAVDDIYFDVETMSSLTDYVVKSASKKIYNHEENFDINKSVSNVYRLLRKQLIKINLNMTLDLQQDIPLIKGNPWKLEQVLLNLFSNSIHAITEIRKYKDKNFVDKFLVRTYYTNYDVVLIVEDNGIGVVKSLKTRMFYPFSTSKKPDEGSGLGLSVVYNIIRQMHGRLDFESTPFIGTIISIIFPVAKMNKAN